MASSRLILALAHAASGLVVACNVPQLPFDKPIEGPPAQAVRGPAASTMRPLQGRSAVADLMFEARGPTPGQDAGAVAASDVLLTAPRDFEAEATAALGSVTACFDALPAERLKPFLFFDLRLTVVASGRVILAEPVDAVPLPGEVVRCIRGRAERVRLRAPVDGAPRVVIVRQAIDLRAAVARARQAAVQAPPLAPSALPLRGVPPAATLPALGSKERPAGFVAPSQTLPAVAPTNQGAQYVPPSSVLPALGPSGESLPISSD